LSVKRAAVTRALIIGSIVVGAFGGAIVDRAVVATPAWRQLGGAAWASYSRHADLGNGLILYPIYGIGLAALTVGAAITYRLDRGARERPVHPSIWPR
jgi:F0F1-type ATP synthase assembly protein I